jgi:hypothetical protein
MWPRATAPGNQGSPMTRAPPHIDFSGVGPPAGERFPDVVLPDQDGRMVDLHQVRGARRALVLFHRSASW